MNNGKYTQEIVKEICGHVRNGLSYIDACRLADINQDTFYEWRKKHPEFTEALKRAEAELKEEHLKFVIANSKRKGPNTWQSSGWLLERRFRDEFGRNEPANMLLNSPITFNILPGFFKTDAVEGQLVEAKELKDGSNNGSAGSELKNAAIADDLPV